MTVVGETLTASSLGPGSGPSAATGPPGVNTGPGIVANSGAEPVVDNRQKPTADQQGLVVAGTSGAGANVNMVTAKIGQELVTSLHLIKDIRRLEKYQRDFFLKVKESLSHVQVLLDHQLMDMAWSDNLIDCEENLLRVSNHLQQSPNNAVITAQQMAELYGILLHDREKLNHRFSELSVKSSLSEFVVNSRQLLDINAVRIAAEAILKNEKPIPAQGDHSIPVDHTFFLANFCTASLASSTMASFLPKQQYSGSTSGTTSGSVPPTVQNPTSVARYETQSSNKKINGTLANQVPSLKNVQQQRQGQPQPGQQQAPGQSGGGGINGIAISEVLNAVSPSTGSVPGAPGNPGAGFGSSGIYGSNEMDGLDTYMSPMTNGMYGQHELVAAISQITADQGSAGAPGSAVVQAQHQQNKAFKQAKKLWTTDGTSASAPSGKSEKGFQRSSAAAGAGSNRYGSASGSVPVPVAVTSTGSEIDGGASDSLSSASEEVASAAASSSGNAGSGEILGDNGKPLSFARIASLNLEKQAIHRPGKLPVPGTGSHAGNNGQGLQHQQQMPQNSADSSLVMMMPGNLAAAAASMASMTMAEAAAVAAAQQSMNHHHHHHHFGAAMAAAGHGYSNQQQAMMAAMASHMPLVQLPPSNNPRFFFDIAMDGKRLGRAIIEVQATLAPKMAQNFHMLVTSEKGFGYRGCQFFQAWRNESVICGDWEHNSGRGGRAAIDEGPLFTPDETKLPCIRGAVGMRRMSKKHSSLNQVASQFRVILANMNTQFTGIFGHVVSGIEALDKVADIGGEGGRPEKIAHVTNCGIYK